MSQARVAYSRELTKALHPTQMELELPLALAGTRKPGLVARVSHRRWQKEADGGGALFPPERPIDGTAYVDVEYSLEGSEEDLEVCARMLARARARCKAGAGWQGVDGRNYRGRSSAQRTSASAVSIGDLGVLGRPPPLADRNVRAPSIAEPAGAGAGLRRGSCRAVGLVCKKGRRSYRCLAYRCVPSASLRGPAAAVAGTAPSNRYSPMLEGRRSGHRSPSAPPRRTSAPKPAPVPPQPWRMRACGRSLRPCACPMEAAQTALRQLWADRISEFLSCDRMGAAACDKRTNHPRGRALCTRTPSLTSDSGSVHVREPP
jgi:hypothetical protein